MVLFLESNLQKKWYQHLKLSMICSKNQILMVKLNHSIDNKHNSLIIKLLQNLRFKMHVKLLHVNGFILAVQKIVNLIMLKII
jgi:hypothetical protein